jgi:hypothetical protein
MLYTQHVRQFSEQIHFELPGDGLGHVLAELSPPGAPLDSRRRAAIQRGQYSGSVSRSRSGLFR